MHFVRDVKYAEEYKLFRYLSPDKILSKALFYAIKNEISYTFKLFLTFEDGTVRPVDLKDHLYGEIFEPLTTGRSFLESSVRKERKNHED